VTFFSGKAISNITNLANIVAGNARATLTAEAGGFPVQFNINPKSVSLAKTNSTEGNRGLMTSSFQDALKATSNIRIELKEAHLTGMGVTHLAVNQLIEWATPVQISASAAFDLGSVRAMESFVKTTASTLTGGTSSESSTLEGAMTARMSRPVYYRLPVLLFSWGAVGPRGRNVRVNLEKVSVDYARFDDLGIPVWAKVALTLVEYTPPTPFTNPTSGGISGRTKHMLSQGENIVQIATRMYGSPNAWRTVAEANGIDDPLRVKPGRTLSLPPSDTVSTKEGS
jgi:hypothetical protein